jgi:alpha-D-xyloside xylohydrolase
LTRYTAYAGRPPLPPPWAFGPWISSDIWRSGGEVRYAVTQFRSRGLPASAFVFDSPRETAYNDFNFNMTQFGKDATIDGTHFPGFASLEDMMAFLQTNGLKVILG